MYISDTFENLVTHITGPKFFSGRKIAMFEHKRETENYELRISSFI